uniref:Uncharacterized protein n=1 Tax=Lepeophtheirus salmonis TaxID=72036 RepID=A0A0K2V105_LEPSM
MSSLHKRSLGRIMKYLEFIIDTTREIIPFEGQIFLFFSNHQASARFQNGNMTGCLVRKKDLIFDGRARD